MNTYAQILVARLLTGLGIGATSGLVPVFQAEAAPPRFRGLVTGSFQLCVTLGIWGVSMTNWGMSSYSGDVSWRIPVSLQMVWSAGLLIGFILSPESPRYLAKQGKWEECRKNLASLRGVPVDDPDIDVSELTGVFGSVNAMTDMPGRDGRGSRCHPQGPGARPSPILRVLLAQGPNSLANHDRYLCPDWPTDHW
jgi:MFS family permease